MSFALLFLIAVVLILLTLLQTLWRNRVQNRDFLQLAWYGVAGALAVRSVFVFWLVAEPESQPMGMGISGLALVFTIIMIQKSLAGGGTKLL